MGGRCPHEQLHECFSSWINQQEKDLDELDQAAKEERRNEERLKLLAEKNIKHFQEYHEKRVLLVKEDPSSSFSPTWCTPFENSFLWIAGCRPTLAIQLIYTLCGLELEAHLTDFLLGVTRGNMGELSSDQLNSINELHYITVREEDAISNRMEGLQEDIGEIGLVFDDESTQVHHHKGISSTSSSNEYLSKAVEDHALELSSIWEDADRLRLKTVKELINILTPIQAVDFLVAAKKLYLSMHGWGQSRRNNNPDNFISNTHEFNFST